MAYVSVSQADHEAAYHDSTSLSSPSPVLPEVSSRPFSLSFDGVSGEDAVEKSNADESRLGGTGVASLLKSLTSSHSYEMVEDDDYDEQPPPPIPERPANHAAVSTPADPASPTADEETGSAPEEQPPVRTASISRHLPLNHPTPDLQSAQGAYLKNVERLEESAERLSMTSSLEEELQKMKQDQRRSEQQLSGPANGDVFSRPGPHRQFSASSLSNSIIGVNLAARSGGYSPAGYITSPTGSIRSGAWPHQQYLDRHASQSSRPGASRLPEAELEGRLPDLNNNDPQHAVATSPQKGPGDAPPASHSTTPDDRSQTSASNDMSRQANGLFTDFDGVHFATNQRTSSDRTNSTSRHISLQHPPLARDSKAYREPQPGEQMIYYPAPVPVMLNLPQRLSKADMGDREKRRLQALSGIPNEMRKSAAWLGGAQEESTDLPGKRATLNLPPQLRASAFFDQPGITPSVQLKNGSAINTLDSILDAAAHAPVSAFTDHPIVGQLGKEVYGPSSPRKSMQVPSEAPKKRRSSLSNILKKRLSSTALFTLDEKRITSRESKALDAENAASGDELDRAAAESISPGEDEILDRDDEPNEEEEEEKIRPGFNSAPTTLLAELQMRKAQQKMRNRTAADAFPNGMHSSLLELDAVMQLQQKSRKLKHITLAWEDHEAAERENFDDEDVPLGILYPEKDRANRVDVNRPMGLMEKREMEDNEPLSHRRARLHGGEPPSVARSEQRSQVEDVPSPPSLGDVPGLSHELPEQEGESLAQRVRRIKEEKEKGTGGAFAEEVRDQLGLNADKVAPPASTTPDGEETLAQRRKRLKEEALKNAGPVRGSGEESASRPPLKVRHSMADILQAHPVGASRQASGESKKSEPRRPDLPRSKTYTGFGADVHTPFNITPAWGANMAYMQTPMTATLPFYQGNPPYMNPLLTNQGAFSNGPYNVSTPMMYGVPMHMPGRQPQYGYGNPAQAYIPDPMMGPPLNAKQRALIDRWRQNIV